MELNQIKNLKVSLRILVLILLATNLLILFVYFEHTANISKVDSIAYVSLQQESSPFNNELEDYIELHSILSQYLKYDEFYNQPLFNNDKSASFFEFYSDKLKKGCEEIRALQIGQTISYNLNISQGRTFNESDFILCDGSKIPIILGNDYYGIYKIGDTLKLEYLYNYYDFEVVGILKKDSKISLNMTYYLNKSIIMPFFVIPSSFKVSDGEIIHYANYASGVVEIPKDRFHEDMKLLKEILDQKICGEYSYAIQQQNYYWKDYLGLYPKTLRNILAIFLIITCILLEIVSIKTTFSLRWNIFLFLIATIINIGFNVFWISFGFRINFIYYMIIPIIYILNNIIKITVQKRV